MIGFKIRGLRNSRKISQQDLSNITGLSKGRIGRIERENVSLTYDEMLLISKALNISVDELAKI